MKKNFNYILNNPIFKYILLFVVLLYSIIFIFFGLGFADSIFYINLCKDITSSPLLSMTLIIGKGWMLLFGDSLISFRILNWLLITLAIFMPFLLLTPIHEWAKNIKYVTFSYFLMTVLNYNVFGCDVCTLFFLSLTAIVLLKFGQTKKLIYLFYCSFASSLLILARFPNILILPAIVLLFGVIEYVNYRNHKSIKTFTVNLLKTNCIFLSVSISFYILINILIFGGYHEFKSELLFAISNSDESHKITSMLYGYLTNFVQIFQYLCVCFFFLYVIRKSLHLNLIVQRVIIVSLIFIFILFLNFEIGFHICNWNLSSFFSAIVFTLLIIDGATNYQNKNLKNLVFELTLIILSIIQIVGSNTGLLRLSPFLIVFLPIIITSNNPEILRNIYLKYFIGILILFVFYTKLNIVYEDSKITDLKYEIDNNKLTHIKTSKVNAEFIEAILKEYKGYKKANEPVLFFGTISHLFYYLTDLKPLYQNSFWMLPDDLTEIRKAEKIIEKKKPVVFFMPEYPINAIQYFKEKKTTSLFETMLIRHNYISIIKNGFIIYNPNPLDVE